MAGDVGGLRPSLVASDAPLVDRPAPRRVPSAPLPRTDLQTLLDAGVLPDPTPGVAVTPPRANTASERREKARSRAVRALEALDQLLAVDNEKSLSVAIDN